MNPLSTTVKMLTLATALLAGLFLLNPGLVMADPSKHLSKNLDFCGEKVPLERPDVYQSVDQNLVLLSGARSRIWLSLKRGDRYLNLVEKALRNASMPDDLKYIPYTLTGFATEHNNAGRGIWKLSESGARAMGLKVDKNVDQRLDPVASTDASVKKLGELKSAYGSWTTAAAAFILGDAAVQKSSLEADGEKNFYKLFFPAEQERQVTMVVAGKMVLGNPAAFGYQKQSRGWPAFSGKRATVDNATTTKALAAHYGKDYKSFRDINPHLLSGIVPAGTAINIP